MEGSSGSIRPLRCRIWSVAMTLLATHTRNSVMETSFLIDVNVYSLTLSAEYNVTSFIKGLSMSILTLHGQLGV